MKLGNLEEPPLEGFAIIKYTVPMFNLVQAMHCSFTVRAWQPPLVAVLALVTACLAAAGAS